MAKSSHDPKYTVSTRISFTYYYSKLMTKITYRNGGSHKANLSFVLWGHMRAQQGIRLTWASLYNVSSGGLRQTVCCGGGESRDLWGTQSTLRVPDLEPACPQLLEVHRRAAGIKRCVMQAGPL